MFKTFARLRPVAAALLAAAIPSAAWAHPEAGLATGFAHGFAHPLSGIDHILAMVAVGLFAARLGGRALWAVPLTFMALMVVGGLAGMAGIALPHVETAIALSVVALGAAVALEARWPVAAAMALVGIFAVFHGHAHGTEMPPSLSAAEYGLGFVTASGLLHLAGIAAGLGLPALDRVAGQRLSRAIGAAIGLAGAGLLLTAG